MQALLLAFAIALIAVFQSSALAGQEGRPHLSSDPRVNDARTLVETGRFGEALSILRPLAPNHADRIDVLFLIGLAALGASRLAGTPEQAGAALRDEAVAAFHAILVDRPELVRVRLELARAFFLKGQDELARSHFERVLAGGPPPAMAANIRRFLSAIRSRRRWSGYFGASLAPDSNINSASDDRVVHIHGLPFTRDDSAGSRSGLGAVVWGGGEYQHPLDAGLRLRTGADIAHREYSGRDFDHTFLAVHAGPRWLLGANTELSLLGSARRRWTAGRPDSRELGVRVEIGHGFDRRLTGTGRIQWHAREYDRDGPLNGPHGTLSFGVVWLARPTVQADVEIGYAHERPQTRTWRNATRWVGLGATSALPYGFTAGIRGEWRRTGYEGRWDPFTPNGTARQDDTRVLRVSVYNRAFTLKGFSPEIVLVNEARTSNAQLYGYRRDRAEIRFVRQF